MYLEAYATPFLYTIRDVTDAGFDKLLSGSWFLSGDW